MKQTKSYLGRFQELFLNGTPPCCDLQHNIVRWFGGKGCPDSDRITLLQNMRHQVAFQRIQYPSTCQLCPWSFQTHSVYLEHDFILFLYWVKGKNSKSERSKNVTRIYLVHPNLFADLTIFPYRVEDRNKKAKRSQSSHLKQIYSRIVHKVHQLT